MTHMLALFVSGWLLSAYPTMADCAAVAGRLLVEDGAISVQCSNESEQRTFYPGKER